MTNQKLYSFDDHPEHKDQLDAWAKKWIANALRTEPMNEEDRRIMRASIIAMHEIVKILPPQNIVFAAGPITAAVAAALAAAVWALREDTKTEYSERELRVAVEQVTKRVWTDNDVAYNATLAAAQAAIADPGFDVRAAEDESADEKNVAAICAQLVKQLTNWAQLRNGGNQWSGRVAHNAFFRYVAQLPIDYTNWDPYEKAAIHGGPRFMHSHFCIVSDMPMFIHQDRDNRPHCVDGPFTAWRDGVKIYRVRGVEVPAEWVEKRKELDPKLALTWSNIEQRRVLVELVGGWNRVIECMSLRVIDEDPDPQIGVLLEGDVPGSGVERFLKVRCGTGRDFVLMVPRELKTAREANARTFRLKPEELQLDVRT